MIRKNFIEIKKDVTGEYNKAYLEVFPEAKEEIDKLAKSPNCSICINGFIKKTSQMQDFNKRLELIYKKPVTADMRFNQKRRVKYTEKVNFSDWEKWFSEKSDQRIQIITAFVNNDDQVFVSYAKLEESTIGEEHVRTNK